MDEVFKLFKLKSTLKKYKESMIPGKEASFENRFLKCSFVNEVLVVSHNKADGDNAMTTSKYKFADILNVKLITFNDSGASYSPFAFSIQVNEKSTFT